MTFGVGRHGLAGVVNYRDFDAGHGQAARAGFHWQGNEIGNHRAGGFGLPPRINNRTALLADLIVKPMPRLRIQRFAGNTEHAQRTQIIFGRPFCPKAPQATHTGWRGVQNRDSVAFDHAPPAAWIGECRRSFIHNRRDAVHQRAIQHNRMPDDPARVRSAKQHITFTHIERPLERRVAIHQIAADGMHHAFGFAG